MRRLILCSIFGLTATLVLLAGCERQVSKEDLGHVVFEMPEVPGWDKPVDLSELGPAVPAKAPPKKPRGE